MKKSRTFMEAQKRFKMMQDLRRDLHMHPELGMQEHRTADIIARHLEKLDMEVRGGVAGTGVVGLLKGHNNGKTVALRADIDALPMEDKKPVSYASSIPGVAHSCGHDAHTAILLGAADILSSLKHEIEGSIKFIFQPSEDTLPGGALPMIEAGVLEKPTVEAIFSLHLNSHFQEGFAAAKSGYASTSSSTFSLTLQGRGGHVAMPRQVVDPIMMAGTVISVTQSILPKKIDPGDPLIFAYGSVHGGSAPNIIPDKVTLTGSIRAGSPEKLDEIIQLFKDISEKTADLYGGECFIDFTRGYPSIYNDPELIEIWKKAASAVVGEERVLLLNHVLTTGDDVSYFHKKVPGVYWHLGIRNEKRGYNHPLHSPNFDFNEEVLVYGAAIQVQAVIDYLKFGTHK